MPHWGCFWRYSSNGWTRWPLPSGSTTCQRATISYPFHLSPARVASKMRILCSSVTSDLSRQMTRDEYIAQAHDWGAAADLLSLGHEQTVEIIGVDLIDNLMDAEPIQTFDGDMGFHYSPEFMTAYFYQARLTRSFKNHYSITSSTQLVQDHRVAITVPKGSRWQTGRIAAASYHLRLPSQNKRVPKCTAKAHQRLPN